MNYYIIDNAIYGFEETFDSKNYNYEKLNIEQCDFYEKNPNASVSEVVNMKLKDVVDIPISTTSPIILESLKIDGSLGEYFICKLTNSGGFEITNIQDSLNYTFLIQNTTQSTLTIFLPSSENDIKSTNTLTIGVGKFREVGMVQNLEKNRIWVYSEELFNS